MKIFRLSFARMTVSLKETLSLVFLIFIVSVFMVIGLTMNLYFTHFFQERIDRYDSPDIVMIATGITDEVERSIEGHEAIQAHSFQDVYFLSDVSYALDDQDVTRSFLVSNLDPVPEMERVVLIGEQALTDRDEGVLLPYMFHTIDGFEIGDVFLLSINDRQFDFTISGFFESPMLGNASIGLQKIYLLGQDYLDFEGAMEEKQITQVVEVSLQVERVETTVTNDIQELFLENEQSIIFTLDQASAELAGTFVARTASGLVILFSVMTLVIALCLVAYRIKNEVEFGIVNLGILKSLGYTSLQMILSFIWQISFMGLVAIFLGVLVGLPVTALLIPVLSGMSGFRTGFIVYPLMIFLSILGILVPLLLMTLCFAWRIKSVRVVTALRGDMTKKGKYIQCFLLDQTKFKLTQALAFKSTVGHPRQSLLFLLVVVIVSLIIAPITSIYAHFSMNDASLQALIGYEMSDFNLTINEEADLDDLLERLNQASYIEETLTMDISHVTVNDVNSFAQICSECLALRTVQAIEGALPALDHEVALTVLIANRTGKGIGDTVIIRYGNNEEEFIVTGLVQQITMSGTSVYMRPEGFRTLNTNFQEQAILVYLADDVDREAAFQYLEAFDEGITSVLDVNEFFDNQFGVHMLMIRLMTLLVFILSVIIISLNLVILITGMVRRSRRRYGLMKSMGFTNKQMMGQIIFSVLPITLIGFLIGGLVGSFFQSRLVGIALSTAGVTSIALELPLLLMVLVLAVMLLLTYFVSWFCSLPIKKVQVTELIRE